MEANAHTAEMWADCSDEHTNKAGFWIDSQPKDVDKCESYLLNWNSFYISNPKVQ